MKVRLLVAAVLAGALALTLSGAEAGGPPVIDGKRVKVLTKVTAGGTQQDEQNISFDATQCTAPKCAVLTFVYKPAKGIKGGLMLTASWTNPATDVDLYVNQLDKHGNGTTVGKCGGAGGPSEKVFLDASELHVGATYAMVAYFWRSISDTVTEKVEINVPSTIKSTVPSAVDQKQAINCTL